MKILKIMFINYKAVSVSVKKKFTLIKNELSYEERINNRILAFQRDILESENTVLNIEYAGKIIEAVYEYLYTFEDEDIIHSTFKLKEAIFYLNHYLVE